MGIWHYTTFDRFKEIWRDGVIKPATAHVEAPERPAVWFSANRFWETTANKRIKEHDGTLRDLDREGTERFGGGLVRIGVAPTTAPYKWNDYKRMSGVRPEVAAALAQAARNEHADPYEWRVSFEPGPSDKWLAIELLMGRAWRPLPADLLEALPKKPLSASEKQRSNAPSA